MFGSATTDRYEPGRSDVDFLVEFFENLPNAFRAYFGLKADLEKIVESPVDLVDDSAIRNPIFARSARIGAVEIYAA
jgi:predicted nucleotidyltransferase